MAEVVWRSGASADERFYGALAMSLAVHAAVLLWGPHHLISRETGASVLTVTFAKRETMSESAPKAPMLGKSEDAHLNILNKSRSIVAVLPAKPEGKPRELQRSLTTSERKNTASGISHPPAERMDSGRQVRQARKPGEASMAIEIAEDGRIGQIIWGKLPAMDRETFNRLEAAIRARGYVGPATSGFLRQTIDVRDYLEAKSVE